ncbi:hypothetical protein Pan216_14310 [Planctomycetes bacterium Pan216]|uniref:WD domain, G-beta repeat n=1 Tax=Kolteria novifilia TaxID=2527975 RepID=A0A518B0S9_9BACT|nr:hypothetical protein Pan216_14310 [Planctomycetes bacterium Pan216]
MSISATCRHCGTTFNVKDSLSGRRLKCKECGGQFKVPSIDDDYEERPVKRRRRRKSSQSSGPILVVTAVVGLGVAVGAVVVFQQMQPSSASEVADVSTDKPSAANSPREETVVIESSPRRGSERPATDSVDATSSKPTKPSTSPEQSDPEPTGWSYEPDPLTLPEDDAVARTGRLEGQGDPTLSLGSPTVALLPPLSGFGNLEVWNLDQNKRVGRQLRGVGNIKHGTRTVNSDGSYVAFNDLKTKSDEVWSTKTGRTVLQLEPLSGGNTYSLQFVGPDKLLRHSYVSGDDRHTQFETFAVPGGELLGAFRVDALVSTGKLHFSPGYRYMVIRELNRILIYDLETGKEIGTDAAEDSFDIRSPKSVAFSPDGKELAVLSEHSYEGTLRIYDLASGKRVLEHQFPSKLTAGARIQHGEPVIQWLPNNIGWLMSHYYILSRKTGKIVAGLQSGDLRTSHFWLLPGDRVLHGRSSSGLQLTSFPHERLEKVLASAESDEPAWLKPGQSVSLNVKVLNARHESNEEVEAELSEALAERLERDGFTVADDQDVTLHVVYGEAKGKTLHEMKSAPRDRYNPLARNRGTPTGNKADATSITCRVAWRLKKRAQPLWQSDLSFDQTFALLRDKLTDKALRDSAFSMLRLRLDQEFIPYYIPEGRLNETLPMLISLD